VVAGVQCRQPILWQQDADSRCAGMASMQVQSMGAPLLLSRSPLSREGYSTSSAASDRWV